MKLDFGQCQNERIKACGTVACKYRHLCLLLGQFYREDVSNLAPKIPY